MAIKAVCNEHGEDVKDFPKLMIGSSGVIVAMTAPEEGFVIRPAEGYYFGEESKKWRMASFSDYNGSLTLKNC